jgi:hypothetical protein
MARHRSVARRAGGLTLIVALGFSCKNLESYTPHLVTIGGTVLQVVALNYIDDKYEPAVNLLMGTLTPAAAGMAQTWAQDYRRQKELAALEKIEQEIRQEQAALERAREETKLAADAAGVIAKGAPRAKAGPLSADVALLRVRPGEKPTPLRDGDVLSDGRESGAPADRLRVLVRPDRDAHVYVVGVDAVGRVQPLFPRTFAAPSAAVPAGRLLQLPSSTDAYGLDEYRGVQQVFVYASERPNDALEAQLARFAREPLPKPTAGKTYVVSEPTLVEAGPASTVSARGLTNVRPESSVELGESGEAIVMERAVANPGESLVVTRWFEHQ